MCHLAEKFHGGFRVSAFQFAICGTHAAKRLNAAIGANRARLALGFANFLETARPASLKVSLTPFIAVLLGQNTDGHFAARINGATILPATTGIFLIALRNERRG